MNDFYIKALNSNLDLFVSARPLLSQWNLHSAFPVWLERKQPYTWCVFYILKEKSGGVREQQFVGITAVLFVEEESAVFSVQAGLWKRTFMNR